MTATALCLAINHLLGQSPWALMRLKTQAKKVFEIHCPPFWGGVFFIDEAGYLHEAAPEEDKALMLTLKPAAFSGWLSSGRIDKEALHLTGDAELAQTLDFLLHHLRWDYEDDLAHLIGDIPAYRLTHLIKAGLKQGRQTAENLTGNAVEYLRDESGLLPSAAEMDAFSADMARLRDGIARAEKRLERSETRPFFKTGIQTALDTYGD
jgi:ubiquinone biosynthesis accessory factor UbiJ